MANESRKCDNTSNENLLPSQENQVSERFRFLWDQYTKIVNLCITLAAGTLLIFANNIFSSENIKNFQHTESFSKLLAVSSVLSIFMGLIFAITWRILSQLYMEKEVFGSKINIIKYLNNANIYDYKYKFEESNSKFKRIIWIISQYGTFAFLFLGWILFILFYLSFF